MEEEVYKPRVGLNNKNKAGVIGSKQSLPTDEEVAKGAQYRVDATSQAQNAYAKQMQNLASILAKKTLPQNKSPKDVENEEGIITNLIKMSQKINTDALNMDPPNDDNIDGGTFSLIGLLIKFSLHFRDRANTSEHQVKILTEEVAALKLQVQALNVAK